MPHDPYALDGAAWIDLAFALAAFLVVLAAYGLAIVGVTAESRRRA